MAANFRAVVGLDDDELVLILSRRMRQLLSTVLHRRADELDRGARDPKRSDEATMIKALACSLVNPAVPR